MQGYNGQRRDIPTTLPAVLFASSLAAATPAGIVAAAILVMLIDEVFDARIVLDAKPLDSSEKILLFSSNFSGAAYHAHALVQEVKSSMNTQQVTSTTIPTPALSISSIPSFPTGLIRPNASSASAVVILPFPASLSRIALICFNPACSWVGFGSWRRTWEHLARRAATKAMPEPIWPAPMTPILVMGLILDVGGGWRGGSGK